MSNNYKEPHDLRLIGMKASNDDEALTAYDIDCRLNDMQPIIASLEYLMKEADRKQNKHIYELIKSAFKMVLIATDLAYQQAASDLTHKKET